MTYKLHNTVFNGQKKIVDRKSVSNSDFLGKRFTACWAIH